MDRMKRPLLHLLFWVTYLLQDSLLMFVWVAPALHGIPEGKSFLMALYAATVVLIPKLVFTYWMLYVIVPKVLEENNKIFWIAIQVSIALLITIIIHRSVFIYYVYAYIYAGAIKTKPVFDAAGMLTALMDIGFVSGLAVTLKLFRIQLFTRQREKDLIKQKLETELKFLRNQTNPHFLFNTLNNIYALARKKSDNTAEIVMKLSKLLRFMLYESGKQHISIAEEIKMLNDYLELEKIRYNERLTISFKRDIDNELQPIAPLLLLPFIENAFKHGVSETRFDSFIDIGLQVKDGILVFRISNTKEKEEENTITDNIGLSNVRRQLELMYKTYQLQVQNENNLFKVLLTINLDSHAKL